MSTQIFSKYLAYLLICLTVLAVFVPLNPGLPQGGLDPSWQFAMNQALAQKLVFGKDIIFTFGPYASVYTKLYHPETDNLMLGSSSLLAISYMLILLLFVKNKPLYGLLLYGLLLLLCPSQDALLFSYPLLLALVNYRITLPDGHENKLILSKYSQFFILLLFIPLGLLPLIKSSLLFISGAIAILCAYLHWSRKNKYLAYSAIFIPFISLILLWSIADQPLKYLPSFFMNTSHIVSGYTEAMAFPGHKFEIILYVIFVLYLLCSSLSKAFGPGVSRIFLFFSYSAFLLIAFKGGFVRHDGHALVAGIASSIAVITFILLQKKPSIILLLLGFITWGYIDKNYFNTSTSHIFQNARNTYGNLWHGVRLRFMEKDLLKKNFESRIQTIRKEVAIPLLSGTTDVYSFEQSSLIASGNHWNPRPVLQSYAAYTPVLAQLNLKHLTGANAPQNILFRIEPIDGRLPALEDGLSWPALIDNYKILKLENNFVYLIKNNLPQKNSLANNTYFYNEKHQLNEEVIIPNTDTSLFAEIEITPTLFGKLISIAFKPSKLFITLKLKDGKRKNYRVIANMAKTGFILSPLVENTKDFILLASHNRNYFNNNTVESITIDSGNDYALFWNKTYTLKLKKLTK